MAQKNLRRFLTKHGAARIGSRRCIARHRLNKKSNLAFATVALYKLYMHKPDNYGTWCSRKFLLFFFFQPRTGRSGSHRPLWSSPVPRAPNWRCPSRSQAPAWTRHATSRACGDPAARRRNHHHLPTAITWSEGALYSNCQRLHFPTVQKFSPLLVWEEKYFVILINLMPFYKEKIMYVCISLSSLKSKIMHFQPFSYDFKFDFVSNFDTPD